MHEEHKKHFKSTSEMVSGYCYWTGGRDIMNMYEVCAKCGHVGKNYYTEKVFAVCADTAKEAAALVRDFPRVKHNHSDAIRGVQKIDKERYEEIRAMNDADPYFTCRNIQEQRRLCQINVVEEIKHTAYECQESYLDYTATYYGKQRLRNPKKYMNRYIGGSIYDYETA